MTDAGLLLSLITVPYLPLLGPAHPDCLDEALVADIFRAGATNGLLPYDKDRRWFTKKPAMILFDAIYRNPLGMIIPVIAHDMQRIRLLCYGEIPTDALDNCTESIRKPYPDYQMTALSFAVTAESGEDAAIIFLKRFTGSDVQPEDPTVKWIDAGNASDLASLSEESENSGFGFLSTEYGARQLGPTFVICDQGQVVAAVGPIDTLLDSAGQSYCLPPYVGVASKYRGQGLGTRVWKAAMSNAATDGATYLMLQAEAGQAAESFYVRQGLMKLGAVITRPVA